MWNKDQLVFSCCLNSHHVNNLKTSRKKEWSSFWISTHFWVSELAKVLHLNHPAWFLYCKTKTQSGISRSRGHARWGSTTRCIVLWMVDKCEIFGPGYFGRGNLCTIDNSKYEYFCTSVYVVTYLCSNFLYKTSLNDWVTNAKLTYKRQVHT